MARDRYLPTGFRWDAGHEPRAVSASWSQSASYQRCALRCVASIMTRSGFGPSRHPFAKFAPSQPKIRQLGHFPIKRMSVDQRKYNKNKSVGRSPWFSQVGRPSADRLSGSGRLCANVGTAGRRYYAVFVAAKALGKRADKAAYEKQAIKLAGGLGFEPRLAESESAVLPLDDPPTGTPADADKPSAATV